MPSVIVLQGTLTDPGNIGPADHAKLKSGMKIFGAHYVTNYEAQTPKKAAKSLRQAFRHALDNGCKIYFYNNSSSKFVEIFDPKRIGPSVFFKYVTDNTKTFVINVHRDDGDDEGEQIMNVAMPSVKDFLYLPLFNRLAAEDYTGTAIAAPPVSTDFFAAATLISRCK
jgi:hypothetical protein